MKKQQRVSRKGSRICSTSFGCIMLLEFDVEIVSDIAKAIWRGKIKIEFEITPSIYFSRHIYEKDAKAEHILLDEIKDHQVDPFPRNIHTIAPENSWKPSRILNDLSRCLSRHSSFLTLPIPHAL